MPSNTPREKAEMAVAADAIPEQLKPGAHLEDLERSKAVAPLEEGPPSPPMPAMAAPVAGGLPAPAYNPAADTEYYRFLFAGVIMFGPSLNASSGLSPFSSPTQNSDQATRKRTAATV